MAKVAFLKRSFKSLKRALKEPYKNLNRALKSLKRPLKEPYSVLTDLAVAKGASVFFCVCCVLVCPLHLFCSTLFVRLQVCLSVVCVCVISPLHLSSSFNMCLCMSFTHSPPTHTHTHTGAGNVRSRPRRTFCRQGRVRVAGSRSACKYVILVE